VVRGGIGGLAGKPDCGLCRGLNVHFLVIGREACVLAVGAMQVIICRLFLTVMALVGIGPHALGNLRSSCITRSVMTTQAIPSSRGA
jgi:hypothetical protein